LVVQIILLSFYIQKILNPPFLSTRIIGIRKIVNKKTSKKPFKGEGHEIRHPLDSLARNFSPDWASLSSKEESCPLSPHKRCLISCPPPFPRGHFSVAVDGDTIDLLS